MIDSLFMFGGRLNRLQYFFAGMLISLIAGAILGVAFFSMAAADAGVGGFAILVFFGLPFLWMSISMQAARIRDIGLNPLPVVGGLMAFYTAAHLAGMAAAGVEMKLVFSGLNLVVQLLHCLFLLFMPGDSFSRSAPPPSFDNMPGGDRYGRTAWDDSAIPSTPAPAHYASPQPAPVRATRQPQAHAKPAFGRRGL